jgi:hypothetical protein
MILINRETLYAAVAAYNTKSIQSDDDLLRFALRKDLISIPAKVLKKEVNTLVENSELTIEQHETLMACINCGDLSRVMNNKKLKNLIKVK